MLMYALCMLLFDVPVIRDHSHSGKVMFGFWWLQKLDRGQVLRANAVITTVLCKAGAEILFICCTDLSVSFV